MVLRLFKRKTVLIILVAAGLNFQQAHAQICNDNLNSSTPDSRFIINHDGTVTDLYTGLMWMHCSLGQTWNGVTCSGNAKKFTWREALNQAEQQTFVEYSDWRLPNIKELTSIVEQACYEPSINTKVFPGTPSEWYWSSSPDARNQFKPNFYKNVWTVSFSAGNDYTYSKDISFYVRLVRAGL